MKHIVTTFLLVILVLSLSVAAMAGEAVKPFSGDFSLSGGWTGSPTQKTNNTPTSVIATLNLQLQPVDMGGLRFNLGVVHPFFEDKWGYWQSNRQFTAETSLPLCPSARAFVGYRRYYSGYINDYMEAGIRVTF